MRLGLEKTNARRNGRKSSIGGWAYIGFVYWRDALESLPGIREQCAKFPFIEQTPYVHRPSIDVFGPNFYWFTEGRLQDRVRSGWSKLRHKGKSYLIMFSTLQSDISLRFVSKISRCPLAMKDRWWYQSGGISAPRAGLPLPSLEKQDSTKNRQVSVDLSGRTRSCRCDIHQSQVRDWAGPQREWGLHHGTFHYAKN
jgi:hypothetical protein